MPEIRKANAQVVGISADSHWSHKAFAEKHGLDFPLLADWFGEVGKMYSAWNDKKQRDTRTIFVIDTEGAVAYRRDYSDNQAPDVGEAVKVLHDLYEREQQKKAG